MRQKAAGYRFRYVLLQCDVWPIMFGTMFHSVFASDFRSCDAVLSIYVSALFGRAHCSPFAFACNPKQSLTLDLLAALC